MAAVWLAVEGPWLALGGPFLSSFAQTGLETLLSDCKGLNLRDLTGDVANTWQCIKERKLLVMTSATNPLTGMGS